MSERKVPRYDPAPAERTPAEQAEKLWLLIHGRLFERRREEALWKAMAALPVECKAKIDDDVVAIIEEALAAERTPLEQAICAACIAADVHLECSYPACSCTQIPRAAKMAYEHGVKQAMGVVEDGLDDVTDSTLKSCLRTPIAMIIRDAIDAACLPPAEEEIEVTEAMENVGTLALLDHLALKGVPVSAAIAAYTAMERQRRKETCDDA